MWMFCYKGELQNIQSQGIAATEICDTGMGSTISIRRAMSENSNVATIIGSAVIQAVAVLSCDLSPQLFCIFFI